MYVVVKKDSRVTEYLSPPGSAHSYTKDITKARTFRTWDRAKSECCENETPVNIENILRTPEG